VTPTVHTNTYPEIDPAKVDFSGKAVFVTGGSRGIGRAIVLRFAMAGASYIAAGARSDMSQLARDVEAAAVSANRSPPKFLPVHLEATDPKSVADAAAAIEKEFGRCDVFVNNAGIFGGFSLIGDSDPTAWWNVLDVNVRGTYLVSRALLPLLQKTGDAYIVTVASVGGHLTLPAVSSYFVSKLALIRLSELLNVEYAEKGVLAFSIHPGNCLTDMVGGSEGVNPDLKHGASLAFTCS
jgi:NAD(P)-dependent dehydrogenase (short-subunit alcohol dehydrogenase family)